MVAVVEEWRDNSEKRGKIFFRPKTAFLRENLDRPSARQSSQSLVSSFGCTSRAPTNEECPRSCPVLQAAEPDNREFLAPEMEVADWQTHMRDVDHPPLAKDVPQLV